MFRSFGFTGANTRHMALAGRKAGEDLCARTFSVRSSEREKCALGKVVRKRSPVDNGQALCLSAARVRVRPDEKEELVVSHSRTAITNDESKRPKWPATTHTDNCLLRPEGEEPRIGTPAS